MIANKEDRICTSFDREIENERLLISRKKLHADEHFLTFLPFIMILAFIITAIILHFWTS